MTYTERAFDEKVVKTRKDHTCSSCAEVIPKGSKTLCTTSQSKEDEDDPYGFRMGYSSEYWCSGCEELLNKGQIKGHCKHIEDEDFYG